MNRWEVVDIPIFNCIEEEKHNLLNNLYSELQMWCSFLVEADCERGSVLKYEITCDDVGKVRFFYHTTLNDSIVEYYLKGLKYISLRKAQQNRECEESIIYQLVERKISYRLSDNNLDYSEENIDIVPQQPEFGDKTVYRIPIAVILKENMHEVSWNNVINVLHNMKTKPRVIFDVKPCSLDMQHKLARFIVYGSSKLNRGNISESNRECVYDKLTYGEDIYLVTIYAEYTDSNAKLAESEIKLLKRAIQNDIDIQGIVDSDNRIQKRNIDACEGETYVFVKKILNKAYTLNDLTKVLAIPFSFNGDLPYTESKMYRDFSIPTITESGITISQNYNKNSATKFMLGNVKEQYVLVDWDYLTQHMFVTGTTGSGKTTYIKHLLRSLPNSINFMVIDPVKDEYAEFLTELSKVKGRKTPYIIKTNCNNINDMEKFNLFVVPKGCTLNAHIALVEKVFISLISSSEDDIYDYVLGMIKETYRKCFFLGYAKLHPSVCTGNQDEQKKKMEELWKRSLYEKDFYHNLTRGQIVGGNTVTIVPKLDDIGRFGLDWIRKITKGISGADSNRVRSKGDLAVVSYFERWWERLKTAYPYFYELFSQNDPKYFYDYIDKIDNVDILITLNQLRDISEKKSIFMFFAGVLDEYRRGTAENSGKLIHLTIFEEAHTIAANGTFNGNQHLTKAEQRTNTMMSEMLAEIRAFGEGLVIVEQSPCKLIKDVIINTSTRIIKRIGNGDDIDYVSNAVGLTEKDRRVLGFLKRSESIAYISGIGSPILITNKKE